MSTKHGGVSFNVAEASIDALRRGIRSRELLVSGLIDTCLERVERWDRAGPKLAAVLALNPRARQLAARCDHAVADGSGGPLCGIPVAVKDNCDTAAMPTTGGCLGLRDSRPARDSAVVRRLKDAGAIILAKTNLHELALAGLTESSLGGQTLNPYDLTRTPGGSSGGSGVAVTMGFAAAAIGTDTVNSIRSPSSANSIVGLRPTRGLISRAGIIPVSETQDAVGPLARTVFDIALLLDALAGYDPEDPATARCIGQIPDTYTASLQRPGLSGRRFGIIRGLQGTSAENREVNAAVEQAIAAMRGAGAEVLSVDEPFFDAEELIENLDVQKWEFRHLFDAYLKRLPAPPVRDLAALIASGAHLPGSLAFFKEAVGVKEPDRDPEYLRRLVAIDRLRGRVFSLMAKHRLDALAYPLQRCLVVPIGSASQAQRNGILASLIGFPALTLPMGFSRPTPTAPIGIPMGLDLMARPFHEPLLLSIGHAFEQVTHARRAPALAHEV